MYTSCLQHFFHYTSLYAFLATRRLVITMYFAGEKLTIKGKYMLSFIYNIVLLSLRASYTKIERPNVQYLFLIKC